VRLCFDSDSLVCPSRPAVAFSQDTYLSNLIRFIGFIVAWRGNRFDLHRPWSLTVGRFNTIRHGRWSSCEQEKQYGQKYQSKDKVGTFARHILRIASLQNNNDSQSNQRQQPTATTELVLWVQYAVVRHVLSCKRAEGRGVVAWKYIRWIDNERGPFLSSSVHDVCFFGEEWWNGLTVEAHERED